MLFLFIPTVFQTHSLVEYKVLGSRVGIHHEVADALELQILTRFYAGKIVLHVAVFVYFQTVGVQKLTEIAVVSRWILDVEKTVILPDLCASCSCRPTPNGAFPSRAG